MNDAHYFYDDELLRRESGGDKELFEAIVRREIALEDFLERRHSVINESELLGIYHHVALGVKEMKKQKNIPEPAHVLESDN